MATKIIIAAHKQYRMPDDPVYVPVQVGAACNKDADGNPVDLGFLKDNSGDNISAKNPHFCELTGLYWAWKNLEADHLGLAEEDEGKGPVRDHPDRGRGRAPVRETPRPGPDPPELLHRDPLFALCAHPLCGTPR